MKPALTIPCRKTAPALMAATAAAVVATFLGAAPAYAGANDLDFSGAYNMNYTNQGPASGTLATVGQTFTAPVSGDHFLTSFSFSARLASGSVFQDIAAIYAWNGTTATGTVLYSSTFFISSSGFTTFTFDTNSASGGLSLTSGNQYVMVFTAVGTGNPAGANGSESAEASSANPYSGGQLVYSFDRTKVAGAGFANPGPTADLAFKATFGSGTPAAPVPEPGVVVTAFSMAGMTGLALVRGRRRQGSRLL